MSDEKPLVVKDPNGLSPLPEPPPEMGGHAGREIEEQREPSTANCRCGALLKDAVVTDE